MATIRKRKTKSGELAYTIQVKFTDKGSGQQILRTTTWKPEASMSVKQAERAAEAFAENYEKQVKESATGPNVAENPNITFREYCIEYLEKSKKDHSIRSYLTNRDSINVAIEYIGSYKIRDLTPAIIQNFYDKLDKRQKITSTITPKPEFRALLESHGFTYNNLRYDYGIQHHTLSNVYNGKSASKKWGMVLVEKTKIPFNKLFTEKTLKEPYAYETTHRIKRTVRAILSKAKKSRLVADNYATADYIDFPKRHSHKMEFMDDKKAMIFYKSLMEYPDIRYKTAMLTFLLTGFRRGEVAGLEWGDINFENKTITVSRSATTAGSFGVVVKEPKTETSIRTITLSDTLINTLKEYREWWLKRREALGDFMQDNNYVFAQDNGKRVYPGTYSFWFAKVLKAAGLEHYTLHSLRHTNITMQLAAGVPLITVAARAGHARASTTSDIYAHFIKSSDKSAAAVIDKVFNPELPQSEIKEIPSPITEEKIIENAQTLSEVVSLDKTLDSDEAADDRDLVEDYKYARSEMKRLGLSTYEEYQKYLEYVEFIRRARASREDGSSM